MSLHLHHDNGDQAAYFPISEFYKTGHVVFDMNDEQKSAHAQHMKASASNMEADALKKRAEAWEINARNGWSRFRLICAWCLMFMLVLMIGALFGMITTFSILSSAGVLT